VNLLVNPVRSAICRLLARGGLRLSDSCCIIQTRLRRRRLSTTVGKTAAAAKGHGGRDSWKSHLRPQQLLRARRQHAEDTVGGRDSYSSPNFSALSFRVDVEGLLVDITHSSVDRRDLSSQLRVRMESAFRLRYSSPSLFLALAVLYG